MQKWHYNIIKFVVQMCNDNLLKINMLLRVDLGCVCVRARWNTSFRRTCSHIISTKAWKRDHDANQMRKKSLNKHMYIEIIKSDCDDENEREKKQTQNDERVGHHISV